jgi:protein-tyrosine phosphatase
MIDLHSHVLPGIDDGAATIDDSLDILRAAQADGIARIAATPHVRHDLADDPRADGAARRATAGRRARERHRG